MKFTFDRLEGWGMKGTVQGLEVNCNAMYICRCGCVINRRSQTMSWPCPGLSLTKTRPRAAQWAQVGRRAGTCRGSNFTLGENIDTLLTCVMANFQFYKLALNCFFYLFSQCSIFFEDLGGKYKIGCFMMRSSYYPKCCQKIVVWFYFPPCTLVWEWLLWLQITFIITTKLWDTSCLSPPVSVIPSQKLWQMSLLPFWKT